MKTLHDLLNELDLLTEDMLTLSEANQFEGLSELLEQYSELSQILTRSTENLSASDAALAQQIIKKQENINTVVAPWLDQIRVLFKKHYQERSLANAYRTQD